MGTDAKQMVGPLPHDLSKLSRRMRNRASEVRDRRVAKLLDRWPYGLTDSEARELRRLWDERVRLARHAGIHRLQETTEGRTHA